MRRKLDEHSELVRRTLTEEPMRTTIAAFSLLALLAFLPTSASAQQTDLEPSSSLGVARTGELSPMLLSAKVGDARALALGDGGFDTARRGGLFDSAAEAHVWGPIALRGGATYSDDTRRMRPSIGVRVGLLHQERSGVDASLSSFFKTEGFDETEGEIETTFAVGHRFEHTYLLGNLAYGQDPEGNERDGEIRASVLRSQGAFVFGLEGRGRSAIGPQHGMSSAVEPRLDLNAGAIGMVSLGSFVLFAETGPSALRLAGSDMRWGVTSLAGLGAPF
jgi:hypothetical protein